MFQGQYFRQVGNRPNSGLQDLFEDFSPDKDAAVLDIGAGNLRDAVYCLQYGFKEVVAVDSEPQCLQFAKPGITFCIEPIQQHQIPADRYSLILACNALFFLTAEELKVLFPRILRGLKKKGIFFFNLLGEKDDWARLGAHPSGAPVHASSPELIKKLFTGFTTEFEIEDFGYDNEDLRRQVFSFVLAKP